MSTQRPWHAGPPPAVGWWQASTTKTKGTWRWWNGYRWSRAAYPQMPAEQAAAQAAKSLPRGLSQGVMWTWDWPAGARVERPRQSQKFRGVVPPASPWLGQKAKNWRTDFPPESGWYNAATSPRPDLWRWADVATGTWSMPAHESSSAQEAGALAEMPSKEKLPIRWTTRRPHRRSRHARAKLPSLIDMPRPRL